jgi:hypothetical protein
MFNRAARCPPSSPATRRCGRCSPAGSPRARQSPAGARRCSTPPGCASSASRRGRRRRRGITGTPGSGRRARTRAGRAAGYPLAGLSGGPDEPRRRAHAGPRCGGPQDRCGRRRARRHGHPPQRDPPALRQLRAAGHRAGGRRGQRLRPGAGLQPLPGVQAVRRPTAWRCARPARTSSASAQLPLRAQAGSPAFAPVHADGAAVPVVVPDVPVPGGLFGCSR